MLFEEFQDGHHGGHLGYQNRTILAILNLYVTLIPPIKFGLNLTYRNIHKYWDGKTDLPGIVWEEMSFEEFQYATHSTWGHYKEERKKEKYGRHTTIFDIGMERF